jgi:VanZ family protein
MIDLSRHGGVMKGILLLAVLIVAWLTLTPKAVPLPGADLDKLAHLGAFFTLALLTDLAWPERPLGWRAVALLWLYGAGIEIAQHYVPNRSLSAADLAADIAGVLLYAWLLAPWLRPRLIRQAP